MKLFYIILMICFKICAMLLVVCDFTSIYPRFAINIMNKSEEISIAVQKDTKQANVVKIARNRRSLPIIGFKPSSSRSNQIKFFQFKSKFNTQLKVEQNMRI